MSTLSNPNSALLPILRRLAQILNEHQISYALIGGLASATRGEVRSTADIDCLLKIPQLQLPAVLDALVESGFQIDPQQAIKTWNQDRLLDFYFGSVRIDWLYPVLPTFDGVLSRARWENVDGAQVRVADAEGLLLLKLLAFRGRDQEDIKGILVANRSRLDLDWVRREWSQIAPDDDPRTAQFEELVTEYYTSKSNN